MMYFTDEVSEETLLSIIDKMCTCAIRAQKAGVDVIQIHGDRLTGCLCSKQMNHRTDKFGGSLENRARFARMLVINNHIWNCFTNGTNKHSGKTCTIF